jgi:hypothetical protein
MGGGGVIVRLTIHEEDGVINERDCGGELGGGGVTSLQFTTERCGGICCIVCVLLQSV